MGMNEMQQEALSALRSGANVFLSGAAGTGKSFVIKSFINEISNRKYNKKNILICAPTGIAALNIGGATLHRTFGIKTKPFPFKNIEKIKEDKVSYKTLSAPPDTVILADIIIIDEISMCRIDTFEYVSKVLKAAIEQSKPEHKDKQLIVVGDFHQLPPVLADNALDVLAPELEGTSKRGFAFEAPSWNEFDFRKIVLTEVVRQANSDFAIALNAVRIGNESGIEWIEEHSAKKEVTDGIYLCATKKTVNELNSKGLENLKGEETIYLCKRDRKGDGEFPAPDELHLKVGAKVIILVNDTSTDNKYQNGTLGTVSECCKESVKVKIKDSGEEVEFREYTWNVIKYTRDGEDIIPEVIGSFTQIPLNLAYAITIHKSQGQTYDAVNFYPACFDSGQLYVGLSRCKNVEKMHIMGGTIGKDNMKVCQAVCDFYGDNVVQADKKVKQPEKVIQQNEYVLQYNVIQSNTEDTPTNLKKLKLKNKEEKTMEIIEQIKEPVPEPTPAKPVTLQIRADEQVKAQFSELCGSLGLTQGAAMQTLLHVFELEQAKGAIAGSADVIDDIRSHVDSIINAFIGQLERNQNADNRIRQDYADKLDSLQRALTDYQTREQQARDAEAAAQQERDEAKAAAEQAQTETAAKVAAAEERAVRAEQTAETEKAAASDARRTADTMSRQIDELTAERDKLRSASERADKLAADLSAANDKIKDMTAAAKVATAEAEVEKEKAVAATKDDFRDKLDKLHEELDKVKDEMREIEKERDNLKRQLELEQNKAK